MKKIVIWIHGGNGSGKTTQSKLLTEAFGGGPDVNFVSVQKEGVYYTVFPEHNLAVLGKVQKNACTGLDSVYPKLKAEGIGTTMKAAIEDDRVSIIILECMFSTIKWYDQWVKLGLRDKFTIFSIHLEMDLWSAYKRICMRRAAKKGRKDWWNFELQDTVYKNVGNKNKETRIIQQKLTGTHHEKHKNCTPIVDFNIQIDANKSINIIHREIKEFIISNI